MSHQTPLPPQHIAIICDGNRRWARQHGRAVFFGHHWAVHHIIEPLIDQAALRGIKYLTFWLFSTENWQREKREVNFLMNLFRKMFDKQIKQLHKKNMKLRMIGNPSKFDKDIQQHIVKAVELTKENTGMTVILALNYGGRDEIIRGVNTLLAEKIDQAQRSDAPLSAPNTLPSTFDTPLSAAEFSSYLDTKDIPDPDFIIRTGGEQRLSGFLSWQAEYTELAFPLFSFPEFTPEKFDELLEEFQRRHRRHGA